MSQLLSQVQSPVDLQKFSDEQLRQLTQEIRDELVRVLSIRPAHFASNLGVVELALALHLTYDFSRDRLIWDTGHQIYPHKLITGRYNQFASMRTRGGLMGYPNPNESIYDLFMTGHAGCSVSTVLGLKTADDLLGENDRHSVAVVGDGALVSGIVFEAMNNAGWLRKKLLVILNDNKMSICPRVGAMASYLDHCRRSTMYTRSKRIMSEILPKIPVIGGVTHSVLEGIRDNLKAVLKDGMLFEEIGFRYYGPVNGHDLPQLRRTLAEVKRIDGPVLLHVFTEKGHGVPQASEDPVTFHTPPVFEKVGPDRSILSLRKGGSKAYTDAVSATIDQVMEEDARVTVMTAGMCQGNKLERIREKYPTRFYDVGICESHAVAFAAGQAKAGIRPIVNIYSTFLQRSFDQIFQEVALQNLPVTFTLDRSGLTGPDGPTHHGCFDISYMRLFPNMVVMAPGDEQDVAPMLRFAIQLGRPASMRYPKASLEKVERTDAAIKIGKAEVFSWGRDGAIVAFGSLFPTCVKASQKLLEEGIEVGVINARFVKPLDEDTLCRAVRELPFVLTVEEGTLVGGFGSALLEAANSAGIDTQNIVRLGIPDQFIEHAERGELLAELGLDVNGICRAVRAAVGRQAMVPSARAS